MQVASCLEVNKGVESLLAFVLPIMADPVVLMGTVF